MSEPKPMASLNAGLLARKGDARPAMRRAFSPNHAAPALPVSVQDDLGWNDMGHDDPHAEPPPLMVAKAVPAVVRQRAELETKLHPQPQAVAAPQQPERAQPDAEQPAQLARRAGKAAFTLRLDPERHLRLRLACAVDNRSAQQIVTQALDAFLNSQPQIDALAAQIPRGTTGKK